MLSFMKKILRKGNRGGVRNEKVSTANMSVDEYIKAIEDGILPHWADEELMRKTGIKNLFAEGAQVTKEMSYEDACDCLNRALRMVDMATYVSDQFGQKLDEMDRASEEDRSTFYSADTLRDLFIEANANVERELKQVPKDANDAVERLNTIIKTFNCVKEIVFISIIGFANAHLTEMVGFQEQ